MHGDDFTFLGAAEDLEDMAEKMRSWYEIKIRGVLGGEPGDQEEITILNRKLRWKGDTIEHEADEKHVKTICEELGLSKESKALACAIVKESISVVESEDEELCKRGEEIPCMGRKG